MSTRAGSSPSGTCRASVTGAHRRVRAAWGAYGRRSRSAGRSDRSYADDPRDTGCSLLALCRKGSSSSPPAWLSRHSRWAPQWRGRRSFGDSPYAAKPSASRRALTAASFASSCSSAASPWRLPAQIRAPSHELQPAFATAANPRAQADQLIFVGREVWNGEL